MIAYSADSYTLAVLQDTPTAFWRFDEAVGAGTLADSSGNGNGFAKPADWTLGQAGPLPDGHSAVKLGGVNWGSNVLSQGISGACAVEFWMLASSFSGAVCGSRTGSDMSFDCQVGAGVIHADIGNGAAWLSTSADMNNLPAGPWLYVVYNFLATGWQGFVNARQLASGSYSGTPLMKDATHTMTVGWDGRNGDSTFIGTFANLAIYSHVLTADRQAIHYAGGTPLGMKRLEPGRLQMIGSG